MPVSESSVANDGRRYGVVVRPMPDRPRFGVDTTGGRMPTTETVTVIEGTPGKSAYDLAVEQGYTGTLEQWVMGQIPTVVMTAAEYAALPVKEPGTLYIVKAL
jgi:hypothetical protein